jgi:hypothetical protein
VDVSTSGGNLPNFYRVADRNSRVCMVGLRSGGGLRLRSRRFPFSFVAVTLARSIR